MMFIVIEGLDGVGKSTISKALATELSATNLASPTNKFKEARCFLEDAYVGNPFSRQLFYASTVLDVSNDIRELIKSGENVVLDRYWLSTQVYHDWKCEGDGFSLAEVRDRLLVPDFTIYLELPLIERRLRLLARDNNTSEDEITLCQEADRTLTALYKANMTSPISGCWLTVDASLSINEIIKDILNKLETRLTAASSAL